MRLGHKSLDARGNELADQLARDLAKRVKGLDSVNPDVPVVISLPEDMNNKRFRAMVAYCSDLTEVAKILVAADLHLDPKRFKLDGEVKEGRASSPYTLSVSLRMLDNN